MKWVYNLRLGMVVLLLVLLPLHISLVLSECIVCFLCHTLNRSYKRLLFNFIFFGLCANDIELIFAQICAFQCTKEEFAITSQFWRSKMHISTF